VGGGVFLEGTGFLATGGATPLPSLIGCGEGGGAGGAGFWAALPDVPGGVSLGAGLVTPAGGVGLGAALGGVGLGAPLAVGGAGLEAMAGANEKMF
jgi:hypothetical protein